MQKIVVAWGLDYRGGVEGLLPLLNAPASAAHVSGELQRKLRFQPLPQNSPANAEAAILADMRQAGTLLAPGGIVVAYFCGHGVQIDGHLHLCTEQRFIASVELLGAFAEALGGKRASIVWAYDCCRVDASLSTIGLPGMCGCASLGRLHHVGTNRCAAPRTALSEDFVVAHFEVANTLSYYRLYSTTACTSHVVLLRGIPLTTHAALPGGTDHPSYAADTHAGTHTHFASAFARGCDKGSIHDVFVWTRCAVDNATDGLQRPTNGGSPTADMRLDVGCAPLVFDKLSGSSDKVVGRTNVVGNALRALGITPGAVPVDGGDGGAGAGAGAAAAAAARTGPSPAAGPSWD